MYILWQYQQVSFDLVFGVYVMGALTLFGITWYLSFLERRIFLWRKRALSEAKLQHERTFNAFLCHEIRNPVTLHFE